METRRGIRTCSQFRQAQLDFQLARDNVAAQIVTAVNNVSGYREQVKITIEGANDARRSYRLNLQRVEEAEGLPLELLQSIRLHDRRGKSQSQPDRIGPSYRTNASSSRG